MQRNQLCQEGCPLNGQWQKFLLHPRYRLFSSPPGSNSSRPTSAIQIRTVPCQASGRCFALHCCFPLPNTIYFGRSAIIIAVAALQSEKLARKVFEGVGTISRLLIHSVQSADLQFRAGHVIMLSALQCQRSLGHLIVSPPLLLICSRILSFDY